MTQGDVDTELVAIVRGITALRQRLRALAPWLPKDETGISLYMFDMLALQIGQCQEKVLREP